MKIQSNENFNLSLSRMSPYMNRHRRSRLKLDGILIFLLLNIHFINSKMFQQTNTLFLEFQLFILSYIRFPRIDSICVMNVFIISRRRIRDSWFKRSFFFFFSTTVKHWQSLATFSLITDHVHGALSGSFNSWHWRRIIYIPVYQDEVYGNDANEN